MPQSYASLYYHFVFSTKRRAKTIDREFTPRLYEYIGGILRSKRCSLLAAGGMSDHVHLLVSLSRTVTIADSLRDIKSNSSGWIHETFPKKKNFDWQEGYGAFTVSFSQIEKVKGYIANQEKHHYKKTFKEEFLEFLKRHEVPYNEKYIWD